MGWASRNEYLQFQPPAGRCAPGAAINLAVTPCSDSPKRAHQPRMAIRIGVLRCTSQRGTRLALMLPLHSVIGAVGVNGGTRSNTTGKRCVRRWSVRACVCPWPECCGRCNGRSLTCPQADRRPATRRVCAACTARRIQRPLTGASPKLRER